MTPRTRLDGRARGLLAALLAAFAVLGSVVLGPSGGASAATTPTGSLAGTAAARGATPAGVAARDRGDAARSGPRRGAREQSVPSLRTTSVHDAGPGPAPSAGVLLTAAVLSLLGAGLLAGARAVHAPGGCRPLTQRGRGPPVARLA